MSITNEAVASRLSTLDRLLPLWIGLAMLAGLLLGDIWPAIRDALNAVQIATVSLPIAVGLLVMMYPVLAKVQYGRLTEIVKDRSLLLPSLVLNWVVGPLLMFSLAWLFLPDLPEYRTGLIIVGLARCIAMVLIWNDLACGDREVAALFVAINSIFQIVAYSLLAYFYLELVPGMLGLEQHALAISLWSIARMVLIFLGVPLVAGYLTQKFSVRAKGREWYTKQFLPRIGPLALWGLLFTVVILFALQGRTIITHPWNVARIALPLIAYFAIMWGMSFAWGKRLGLTYERNVALSFTAAGNNFELAIAVAIGVFGAASGEALAGVVGPLIEVPALVLLVRVALWARRKYYGSSTGRAAQAKAYDFSR